MSLPEEVEHRTALSDPAEWVDRYGDLLYRYALLRVRNGELAEDLVQETFLAALGARDRFAGRATERTWLVAILRRKIADHLRRATRPAPAEESESRAPSLGTFFDRKGHWRATPGKWPSDPAATLETKEFWEVFRACLSKLRSSLCDAFCLREMDELSTAEVCRILGISATNLSVRVHRARLALRQCLETHWFTR